MAEVCPSPSEDEEKPKTGRSGAWHPAALARGAEAFAPSKQARGMTQSQSNRLDGDTEDGLHAEGEPDLIGEEWIPN